MCVAVAAVVIVVPPVACFSGSCFDCCLMVSAQNEQICWMLVSAPMMVMMMIELVALSMIR